MPAIAKPYSDEISKNFIRNVFEDLFLWCDKFGCIDDCVLAINKNHLYGNFYI